MHLYYYILRCYSRGRWTVSTRLRPLYFLKFSNPLFRNWGQDIHPFPELIFCKLNFTYEGESIIFPFLRMWVNRRELEYKKLTLNFHIKCQYHRTHQLIAEQQHRYFVHLYCIVLRISWRPIKCHVTVIS
jgi:hypothetical protein